MSEIMKRLLILVAALAVLLPGRASAQSSMPFEMSAGLSLGVMDGIGVELGFGVTEKLNVRAGYSVFPNMLIKEYSISLPKCRFRKSPCGLPSFRRFVPCDGGSILQLSGFYQGL